MAQSHHLELKKTPVKKTIFFFNYVSSDGLGDLGHLIDMANSEMLQTAFPKVDSMGQPVIYEPYYVITCNEATHDRLRFIVSSLKENKFITDEGNPFNVNDNLQLSQYINFVLDKNPHVYLCTDDKLENKLVKSENEISQLKLFQKQLNSASAVFQVSITGDFFNFYLQKLSIPCTYIKEHGSFLPNNIFFQSMGFSFRLAGIMLEKPKHITLEEKASVILNLQHQQYVRDILELKEHNTISLEQAQQFLKKNLFIPGYFQHEKANAVFIQSLAFAKIAKDFENVIFHLNGKKLNLSWIDYGLLAKQGFRSITVYSPDTEPMNIELKEAAGNRQLKILKDYPLNNHDYNALFNIAQYFGGCSGDKTLELVLSNGLIPFYEERPWKNGMSSSLAELAELYIGNKNILAYILNFQLLEKVKNNPLDESVELAIQMGDIIDSDFVKDWKILIDSIFKDHNFFNHLPHIVQNTLCLSDFIEAINNKEYAIAKQILAQIDFLDIKNIIEWLLDMRLCQAAAFIYKNCDVSQIKMKKYSQLSLNFLGEKYSFPVEEKQKSVEESFLLSFLSENSFSMVENHKSDKDSTYYEKNILNEFLQLIHRSLPEVNLISNSAIFAHAHLDRFVKKCRHIIENKELDEFHKMNKISHLLLASLDKPPISIFFSTLLIRLAEKENLPIQIYFGLPKTIMRRENPSFDQIKNHYPNFVASFVKSLKNTPEDKIIPKA